MIFAWIVMVGCAVAGGGAALYAVLTPHRAKGFLHGGMAP